MVVDPRCRGLGVQPPAAEMYLGVNKEGVMCIDIKTKEVTLKC